MAAKTTTTVIGVSGINATDNPGPGVGIAKSLKEYDPRFELIGLSYDVHDPGNYMVDLFSNSFLLPYPTKGVEGYFQALKEVQEKTGLSVLLPNLDAELPILIKNKDRLKKLGIHTILPSEQQFELRTKSKLNDLSHRLKCLHPDTHVVYSIEEIEQTLVEGKLEFPIMIKGNYYKAYQVFNLAQAALRATEIASEWGFPLLIQKCVPGKEVNLVGIGDGKGTLLGSVSIKKQLVTALGKVWTAVTIFDQRLLEVAKDFCEKSRWAGPFELECISNDEGIFLIEINPRFPAWTYFATASGVNLPAALIELDPGSGKPNPILSEATPGKYLVRYSTEFVTELQYFQNLITNKNREGQ